jgi:hypothetical protein
MFIGMFALDAVREGVPALLIHLAPAMLLLVVVATAWRWEWIGAAAFIGLAVLYAASARRWDWILVISGPMAVVGLLYLFGVVLSCNTYCRGGPRPTVSKGAPS